MQARTTLICRSNCFDMQVQTASTCGLELRFYGFKSRRTPTTHADLLAIFTSQGIHFQDFINGLDSTDTPYHWASAQHAREGCKGFLRRAHPPQVWPTDRRGRWANLCSVESRHQNYNSLLFVAQDGTESFELGGNQKDISRSEWGLRNDIAEPQLQRFDDTSLVRQPRHW